MLPIMDVSRWQGHIDWDAVKASGLISGVMFNNALSNLKNKKESQNAAHHPQLSRFPLLRPLPSGRCLYL